MENFFDFIGTLWCRLRHAKTSIPTGTYYSCLVCLRRYRVPWADHTDAGVYVNSADQDLPSLDLRIPRESNRSLKRRIGLL